MLVAANIIIAWPSTAASIPSGWSRETALDAKYPKGTATSTDPGGTGGALTHSHTSANHSHTTAHTHTVPDSPAGSGTTTRDVNTTNPPDTHTHTGNPSTTNPSTTTANDTPSTDTVNHEPSYFEVIFIKSDGTPNGLPNNGVALYHRTTLPNNWSLCDGGGSTPNMSGRFMKGAAAAGDGGGTGGGATHSHSISSHTHSTPYAHSHPNVTSSTTGASMVAGTISGGNAGTATSGHTHSLTIGSGSPAITGNTDSAASSNHEPPYVVPGFIQNNTGIADLPDRVIGIWTGTLATIPAFWRLCDGTNGTPDYRSSFLKCSATTGGIGGAGGGSLTHGASHTATGHTHAVASHSHTVSAASGAGENRTAGSTNAATTAHTHPSWSDTGAASFTSASATPTVNNYTDTQPPYYAVAYIQYQAPTTRGPNITPTPKLPSVAASATVALNLLMTTLAAPPVQNPFRQNYWPLPERPAAVVRAADPIPNLLTSTLRPYDPCPAGPYRPARVLNDTGTGSVAWTNPTRAVSSDNDYASVVLAAQLSNYLRCEQFGFNISPYKTITGIELKVECKLAASDGDLVTAKLVRAGVVLSSNKDAAWHTAEQVITYGGPTDLWGVQWSVSDINADLFQAFIWNSSSLTNTLSIDDVTVTVYCTDTPFSQTSWPNPPARVVVQRFDPPNLLANTLAPAIQNPFVQADWPNPPSTKTQRNADHGREALDLATLATNPTRQSDWPNPPRRPSVVNVPVGQDLLGIGVLGTNPNRQASWPLPPTLPVVSSVPVGRNALDLSTLANNPTRLSEWPIPVKGKVAAQADSYDTNNLTLTAPTIQSDWPIPQKGKVAAQADSESSVQLTTMSDVPIRPTDIALPKGRDKSQEPNYVPNLLSTTLAPAAEAKPFSQGDWPIPVRVSNFKAPSSYRLSFGPTAVTFIQNSQLDWPLPPKAPEKPHYLSVLNLALGTMPFSQDDWPNPWKRISLATDIPPDLLTTTLAPVQVQAPFKVPLQPNPIVAKTLAVDVIPNVAIRLQVVPPIRQSDWPIPIGPKSQAVNYLPNLSIELQVVPPPSAVDLPTPKAVPKPLQFDPPNLLGTTLVTVTQDPFKLVEWAVPASRQTQRVDVQPTLLPIAAPFSQGDWPNPPAKQTQRFDTGRNALDLRTLATNPVSLGHNFDWPIPRAATSPVDMRVLIANIETTLLAVLNIKPFKQVEWPIPVGASQSARYFKYMEPINPNITPPPVGGQYVEWIHIRRRRR